MRARERSARFTVEQRTFMVCEFMKLYHRRDLNKRLFVQNKFLEKYPACKVPSFATIYANVTKFRKFGTLENLHKGRSGRRRTVRTAATIARVEILLARDRNTPSSVPVNSSNRNSLNLSRSTWMRILKEDLHLRCYR